MSSWLTCRRMVKDISSRGTKYGKSIPKSKIVTGLWAHQLSCQKKKEEVKLNEKFSLSLQHSLFLLVTLVFFNWLDKNSVATNVVSKLIEPLSEINGFYWSSFVIYHELWTLNLSHIFSNVQPWNTNFMLSSYDLLKLVIPHASNATFTGSYLLLTLIEREFWEPLIKKRDRILRAKSLVGCSSIGCHLLVFLRHLGFKFSLLRNMDYEEKDKFWVIRNSQTTCHMVAINNDNYEEAAAAN